MADKALLVSIIQEKLLPELERRAAPHLKVRKMNKLGVKVKFGDFQQTTKEKRSECIDLATIENLLDEALERGKGKAVRLLGLHIGLDAPNQHITQLRFPFD